LIKVDKMKLSFRLLLAMSISMLVMMLLVLLAISFQSKAGKRLDRALNNLVPSMNDLNVATDSFVELWVATHRLVLNPDKVNAAKQHEVIERANQKIRAALENYGNSNIYDAIDKDLLKKDKERLSAYLLSIGKITQLEQAQGDARHAVALIMEGDVRKRADEFLAAVRQHVVYNIRIADALQHEDEQALHKSQIILFSLAGSALLILALLYHNVYRAIIGGLNKICSTLSGLNTQKDLTIRLTPSGKDEVSETFRSVNALIVNLHASFTEMHGCANAVIAASQALRQTAREVSSASAQQSEVSGSMAASVGQMSVSINHIADRTAHTHQLANEAGMLATQGSSTIAQTIKDIHQISGAVEQSGSSIRELENYGNNVNAIVLVIKEIADQTNLLALNAAIEAARAGELGRGFAVVADEVRKLAERTSLSTQEISETINAMRERSTMATDQMRMAEELVRVGVARADDADQAILRIGKATGATVGMVEEISGAIQEQGVSANNLSKRIGQVAEMADASSGAAEAAAASSDGLFDLAQKQITILGQYRI
jgi:methyl-accepting chemotaxis protein